MNASSTNGHTKVKYLRDLAFHRELKRRVEEYFEQTGLPRRDSPQMFRKTAIILGWFAISWTLLVFVASTWWQAGLLSISLGLAMAGIGFSIQHDGGHGACSERPFINQLMAMTLDLLGGSSYIWKWQHNVIHHSYTNIVGVDHDIDLGIICRFAPQQRRLWFHRFQHLYLWLLYGFLAFNWHFYSDFQKLVQGQIGRHSFPRPKGRDLVVFVLGKVIFFSWAFFVPALFHPLWQIVVCYLITSFVTSLVLSVVFQAAHCVQEAEFPSVPENSNPLGNSWAKHQVETTVNFGRDNDLLTWYVGGLNFQVEHHLFPNVCHIHYPALSCNCGVGVFGVRRKIRFTPNFSSSGNLPCPLATGIRTHLIS
jgi:linoleoyl-CoA desaturase